MDDSCWHNLVSAKEHGEIYCVRHGINEPAVDGKRYQYDCVHHVWKCVPVESNVEYEHRSWYHDEDGFVNLYRDGVWEREPYKGCYTVDFSRRVERP